MKKLLYIALSLLTLVGLGGQARAENSLLFGQRHYYSVTFRSNGEAIVMARIVISNSETTDLSSLQFDTGDDKISELSAFQMILPPACEKYVYNGTNICEKYGDPDYATTYSYNPDGDQIKYYRLKTSENQNDNKISVELNQPIVANKSGAVILSYVSKSYVGRNMLGLRHYNFRTLGAEKRQAETNVAISVDSGLSIHGNNNSYCCIYPLAASTKDMAVMSGSSESGSTPIENSTFDSVVAGIGSGGQRNEKATGIAPHEQFSFKGEYADKAWKLYVCWILLSLITLALVILALTWLIRKIIHRRKK